MKQLTKQCPRRYTDSLMASVLLLTAFLCSCGGLSNSQQSVVADAATAAVGAPHKLSIDWRANALETDAAVWLRAMQNASYRTDLPRCRLGSRDNCRLMSISFFDRKGQLVADRPITLYHSPPSVCFEDYLGTMDLIESFGEGLYELVPGDEAALEVIAKAFPNALPPSFDDRE